MSGFKAILTPYAVDLIAYTVVGSGKTIKVTLIGLDRPDQLGFRKVVGFDTVRFGNRMHFFNFHDVLLEQAERKYILRNPTQILW
jgi:hypothetical protein